MREIPLSNCERDFIIKSVAENKRVDGRDCYDYRNIKISFGVERGCCYVEMGKTRVMCQVSCEVTTPKQARPSEGILFVNVELSPMAAPQFEIGRQSDYGVEITRILERCIKESRCVDTESLCIMSGIKVWNIRVDIHILNHEGGIIDAASIAAITALAHFRRPDVTVSGEEVTIHSSEDRDPVPLSVHHMPICVTFGFYHQGKYLLVDPTEKEERVMDGKMVIAMNKHREICTLQMAGSMMLLKDQVLRCSNIATVKVQEISELIQKALANDSTARATGGKFGFAELVNPSKITAHEAAGEPAEKAASEPVEMDEDSCSDVLSTDSEQSPEQQQQSFDSKVILKTAGTMAIGEGGKNTWFIKDEESFPAEKRKSQNKPTEQPQMVVDSVVLSGDSEEEDVVILESNDMDSTERKVVGNEIDLTVALTKKASKTKSMKKHKHPQR